MIIISSFSININENNNLLYQGVWNNSDFMLPPREWMNAALFYGGSKSVIDIVVAQANSDGFVHTQFPMKDSAYVRSYSEVDRIEPYLVNCDELNIKVILSIQSLQADIPQLLQLLLDRYGDHPSLIGVNIDMEWKHTGIIHKVTDVERDRWTTILASYNNSFKLFLTWYGDFENFPSNSDKLVFLFDGLNDTQANILLQYKLFGEKFTNVGIYTGYTSSVPPTVTTNEVLNSVPDTQYIIHTDDVFLDKPVLFFELDNVNSGWKEKEVTFFVDLHLRNKMPILLGVNPYNLTVSESGSGVLQTTLMNINKNQQELIEIAQLGFMGNQPDTLYGKSYQEQYDLIKKGCDEFKSLSIVPETFIPIYGIADNNTLNAVADLGFKRFIDKYQNLTSERLIVIDQWINLINLTNGSLNIKNMTQITSELEDRVGSRIISIVYEVNDFQALTKTQQAELEELFNKLKSSGKYLFMTPSEYQSRLDSRYNPPNIKPSKNGDLFDYILYFSAVTLIVFSVVYYARIKKRKIVNDMKY